MPFSARHNRDPWIRGRSDAHLLEELLARFAHRSTLCIRFLLIQLCNGRRVPINVLLHLIDLGLKLLVRLQLALSRRLTQSLNRSIDRPSIAAVSGGCTYTIAHWSELRHLHLGCRGLNVDIISNNTSTRSHEHTQRRSRLTHQEAYPRVELRPLPVALASHDHKLAIVRVLRMNQR